MQPKRPPAYGGVCESQAPAQGCGNFYAGLLFSTLLFHLSLTSPLELIWDLERLSLHVRTHADSLCVLHVISSSVSLLSHTCLLIY